MRSYYKDLTILCLEIPWVDGLKTQEGYEPHASVAPFLSAFSVSYGCGFIHRNVYSADDLLRWTEHAKSAPLGKKILWIAGHGVGGSDTHACLTLPRRRGDEKTERFDLLKPEVVGRALSAAGGIEGVVISSCCFGRNAPETWLAGVDANWAIGFTKELFWSDALFFCMKTLEWLYEGEEITSSNAAKERFLGCVSRGGVRNRDDAVQYDAWAMGLGTKFFYRAQRKGWTSVDFNSAGTP